MKYAAIILAAGASSRYGSPKQLLEINHQNLVQRACELALNAKCSPVILILGAHAEQIMSKGISDQVDIIHHSDWQLGMGSSIATGVKRLNASNPEVDASFILLADQPAITLTTLDSLKAAYQHDHQNIIISEHHGDTGPPALFSQRYFHELESLKGDTGGKHIVQKYAQSVGRRTTPEAQWDVDEPSVWDRFLDNT